MYVFCTILVLLQSEIGEGYDDEMGSGMFRDMTQRVKKAADVYGLSGLTVFENLSHHYVLSGLQGQTPIVLKLGLDVAGLKMEAAALKAFQGFGAVGLLAEEDGLLLLDRALSGTCLRSYFPLQEKESLVIACGVMQRLHGAPPPALGAFPHLKDWLCILDKDLDIPAHYLQKARTLKEALLATGGASVLLHGDLHHDNILQQGAGWAVIDPKGVLGEPVYEAAAFIQNPLPDLLDLENVGDIIQHRITIFAERFSVSAPRLLQWCFVRAVLAWAWTLEDGLDPTPLRRLTEINDKQ